MQTLAVALEVDLNILINYLGFEVDANTTLNHFTSLTISQLSPIVPYILLIIVLIARPRGLFGKRDV
jgi:branched-chain amino acid transport system permease protein